ncbi:PilW family protein [Inhella gelatinilytica]|uniref:Type IV pilus assembly protein PilW n=1 Tax=Inhella gelatinilytica TaxID=2795030 RepID=A0A931J2M9_9BURK|nr:hypothetical protein [Inhella gelatinilytica]MBH9554348.1 hypothetical protein [Inhella gelatinilytica]
MNIQALHLSRPQLQRGVSLVELLVGVTAGLFVMVGALSLFATSVQNTRRMVAESRVQQDLRNIADVVTRDLRRGGYWQNAPAGTVATGAGTTVTVANVYSPISATESSAAGGFSYAYSKDADNTLATGESFGFSISDGVLSMQTASGVSYPLNDAAYTTVTAFSVEEPDAMAAGIWLGYRCETVKSVATPGAPYIFVRQYNLSITAQSALDSSIVRTLETTVRVRNNRLTGNCD